MTRWIGSTDDEQWTALLSGYQRSAYRLEGQQFYCSPHEDAGLAQFLSGRPVEVDWSWLRATTQAQIAAGRTKTKVRIVVEPPTPYTRLELTLYPEMAKIGEDIRILAVSEGSWPVGQPHHDYWIFDDRDLWRMHYHENFRFRGAELLEDPEVVAEHRHARDLALAHAVPLQEYLASLADESERSSA